MGAKMNKKTTKNIIKILEKTLKNNPKWMPKSFKIGPRRCLERVLGQSWLQVEGFGPILAPKADLGSKMRVWGSILAPKWEPKSMEIASKSDPKGDDLLDTFWNRLLERFGANLAPTWLPKPSPNGAKLVPKSIQVGMLIWHLFWKGSWLHFYWFLSSTCQGWNS